jgi:histidyl-tRNA synthetase
MRHDRSFVCSCGGVRVPATMAGGGLYRDLVKQATGETIRSIGKALGIDPSCVPE